MRRAAALATVLALTLSVGACGKDSENDVTAGGTAGTGGTQAPAASGGSQAPGTAQPGSSTDGGGTPQEAVTNLFHAIGADDYEKACRQMAYGDAEKKPVPSDAQQMAGCKTNTQAAGRMLPAEQKPILGLVTVTSAQESGDTAKVEGKDISAGGKTLEGLVSEPLTLTKIDGRWYVDVLSLNKLMASVAAGGASAPTS